METKGYLQSKTMCSLIVVFAMVVVNMMGIGEAEVGETIDSLVEMTGEKTVNIKDVLMLLGIGGAAYGRAVANKPLARKKKVTQ